MIAFIWAIFIGGGVALLACALFILLVDKANRVFNDWMGP